VLWPIGVSNTPPSGFCSVANTSNLADPNSVNSNQPTYHAIYLTTNIVENTSQ
jgi:hypothetical protein